MDKEISEWIDGQIRSRAHDLSLIKKCGGPFCRNPDPLKEDLKILNRIKKELGAKGEAKRAAHEYAMLAWLADQVASCESYIDDYDYYAKIIQAVEKILMDDPREKGPKEKRILDDVEKRYLKSVIRPFKNDVAWVMLAYDWAYGTKVHLEICCRQNGVESHIQFPPFAPNAMYENMEIGKRYAPKELELDD